MTTGDATFDYDMYFAYYKGKIQKIRQAKKHGEESVAKPVLLLTIIDSITYGEITSNQIHLTENLIDLYERLMETYAENLRYFSNTPISNPFWHMQSDGFWDLYGYPNLMSQKNTPSLSWLQNPKGYGAFEEYLWMLLQQETWRIQLRNYIVEHKLSDDFWSGKIAAEGLSIITAALILAA